GRGFPPKAGEPHAEVFALRDAAERSVGATAYVTLEPCSHQGRTPPCADALIAAGVSRVVVAMEDPNPQVSGRGIQRIREAGIAVEVGLLEEEATQLNRPFLCWITHKRPLITLKAAASLDGKIATHTNESQWITGPDARRLVHRHRDRHDVVMVGIGTVLADEPQLTCRVPRGRDPIRLVVDSKLSIPEEAALFTSSETAPLWIAVADGRYDTEKAAQLMQRYGERAPALEIIVCRSTCRGRVDLQDLMWKLGEREITSLFSESGGRLTYGMLASGLADRLMLFLAPKLIGGRDAPGILDGLGVTRLSEAPVLKNMTLSPVGEDVVIEADFGG
ncbi:MAG: bifunctional diaminohydroxyphosphoribosylaminopyrimidine deaminase/5-amino-6-(5-phosphoribosylamino)uracil reductase RibD, partial [Magnetococcales bacterium]|nr:bifunctional diaminohydroxyphosphoribosylaminopyrimidine deaminase/5-amino-6-(5-phosphoribosylamino)uracil reductase RibD [Magnetococcales bacterium]